MQQTPLIAHEALRVELDPERQRYSLFDREEFIGFLDFTRRGAVLDLQHTIIKEEFARHGYARALVTIVLERVWGRDERVIPTCSYVVHFLERFPQYAWLAVGADDVPDDGAAAPLHGRHTA